MKVLCVLIALFIIVINSSAQNVGIGTTNPVARLHVADSCVIFTGPSSLPVSSGSPVLTGPGTRFIWSPEHAALRAGFVTGPNWDKDSIGQYSFASGYNSKARANYTTAMGWNTTATGLYSVAMGASTSARGIASLAMGNSAIAIGDYSTALGYSISAKALGSITIGRYNDISDNPDPIVENALDRIFQIGNGGSGFFFPRANALTVLRNGRVGIGTVNPTERLEVNGNIRAVTVIQTSDARFKENIQDLNHSLEKILQLRGVSFSWKSGMPDQSINQKSQIGFIAQDVEIILPELVQTGSDGYKAVDYSKLTAVLTEAIKEQQRQIELHQKQNEEQQKQINDLKQEIKKFKK